MTIVNVVVFKFVTIVLSMVLQIISAETIGTVAAIG